MGDGSGDINVHVNDFELNVIVLEIIDSLENKFKELDIIDSINILIDYDKRIEVEKTIENYNILLESNNVKRLKLYRETTTFIEHYKIVERSHELKEVMDEIAKLGFLLKIECFFKNKIK